MLNQIDFEIIQKLEQKNLSKREKFFEEKENSIEIERIEFQTHVEESGEYTKMDDYLKDYKNNSKSHIEEPKNEKNENLFNFECIFF